MYFHSTAKDNSDDSLYVHITMWCFNMNVRIGALSTSQKIKFFLDLHNTLKSYPQRERNFYIFQVLFMEYSIVALCNFYSDFWPRTEHSDLFSEFPETCLLVFFDLFCILHCKA